MFDCHAVLWLGVKWTILKSRGQKPPPIIDKICFSTILFSYVNSLSWEGKVGSNKLVLLRRIITFIEGFIATFCFSWMQLTMHATENEEDIHWPQEIIEFSEDALGNSRQFSFNTKKVIQARKNISWYHDSQRLSTRSGASARGQREDMW